MKRTGLGGADWLQYDLRLFWAVRPQPRSREGEFSPPGRDNSGAGEALEGNHTPAEPITSR